MRVGEAGKGRVVTRRQSQSSSVKPAHGASASDAPDSAGSLSRRSPGSAGSATRPSAPASGQPIRLSDLYRGHGRLALIRDLAFGEFSYQEIARSIGCTARDIAAFAENYADEITEVRAALAGQLAIETAGLWVAKRQNRLAELQSDVEDLNSVLDDLREMGRLGGKTHHDTVKVKIAALRAAADELTPRGTTIRAERDKDDKNVVHYVIEDPDAEAMT